MDDLNRYYFRETTDFGDETVYWRDVTHLVHKKGSFTPDHDVEYVIKYQMNEYCVPFYVWNKCVDEYRYYPHNYSCIDLSQEDFERQIEPYIVNKEEKMHFREENNLNGITGAELQQQIRNIAQQEVLAAIAQHEKTKIEINDYDFCVGDKIMKHSGDYKIEGTVVGCFKTLNSAKRYVVEHVASGGGSFCHIYSSKNIMLFDEWYKQREKQSC